MTKEEKKLKKLIEESEKILVTTHASPDSDAKSSTILIYHALVEFFKKDNVEILVQDVDKHGAKKVDWGYVKEHFKYITRDDEVDFSDYDLIIMTDVDQLSRSLAGGVGERESYKLVTIDHHRSIEESINNADIFINDHLSSAAEQVYTSFKSILGDRWTQDEYVSRMTQYGIIADTFRFMYEMVQPSTYRVMADLLEVHRVDVEEFTNSLSVNTTNSYLVLKECLENFRIVDNWGYSWVTKKFILDNDLTIDDLSNGASAFLQSYVRKLDGIDWAFMLKESMQTEGQWGISFRSMAGAREVNKIAEKLGGGGHKWAAGSRFMAEDKDDAIQQVLSAIE